MKKVVSLGFIIIVLSAFTQNKRIAGKWKLHSIKEIKSGVTDSTFKDQSGLSVQFSLDTVVGGRLNVNTFGGSYHIDKNKIKINIGGVTEACCDKKSGEQLLKGLGSSHRFFVKEDTLILTGDTRILRFIKIR